jgi:hypothetical protein
MFGKIPYMIGIIEEEREDKKMSTVEECDI